MTTLGHARLGLRLARREARRHPWRTSLVLLMVVIPTFGMTVGATLLRTGEWSAEDQQAAEYGQAAAIGYLEPDADGVVDPAAEGRLRAALPAGSLLIAHSSSDRARLPDRRTYLTVTDLDLGDPMVEGRFGPVDGRLPIEDDEAVLTTDLLDDLDLGLGDTITPERFGRSLLIVGAVEPLGYDEQSVFVDGPVTGANVDSQAYLDSLSRIDDLDGISGWGFSPTKAIEIDCYVDCSDDEDAGVFWTYLGGAVALLVLGTVIAAAFAVGARRQLHTIGLLSATGGSPRTVRWFLLAQGLIGGAMGALVGVGLGVVLTRLIPDDWLESLTDRPVSNPVTRLGDVVPILLIGTAAAIGAAWLPARSAARVPTLQALAGRRPQPKVPRGLPLLGALAVAGGCLLLAVSVASSNSGATETILLAVAGSVAVLLGALAVGPWAVAALERLSGRWPEAGRLAGRSLARSRLRSSAVVGAICAVAATAIAGSTLYRTYDAEQTCCDLPYAIEDHVFLATGTAHEVPEDTVDEVLAVLGEGEVIPVANVRFEDSPRHAQTDAYLTGSVPEDSSGQLIGVGVATPEVLAVLEVPSELRDGLDAGEAIAVTDQADGVTEATITNNGGTNATLPFGGSFDSPAASYGLPQVLISPETAEEHGLVEDRPRILVDTGRPITDDELDELALLADDIAWNAQGARADEFVSVYLPDPEPAITEAQVRVIVYAALMLVIGAVVAVGLALAAKDSEDEARVLVAVGAPPRTVRRVAALRAGLLVATATAIALPAGLLPAWAITSASSDGRLRVYDGGLVPFRLDVVSLVFLVVAVPVIVMAVALAGTWLRDHLRRTRPLVFALAD